MSEDGAMKSGSYTPYHPRWYRRRVSVWWWLKRPSYTIFVAREMTSVPVAWFAAVLMWEICALSRGPEAYARFLAWMAHPLLVLVNFFALAAVLFHAITWFNLAPKAMVVRMGGRRVPDVMISGMNYAAWIVLTAAVAFIVVRG